MLEGVAWQRKNDIDVATYAAWRTAGLMRTSPKKKLPSLKSLLATKEKPRLQTIEQQAAILRALHAACGGVLTTKTGTA